MIIFVNISLCHLMPFFMIVLYTQGGQKHLYKCKPHLFLCNGKEEINLTSAHIVAVNQIGFNDCYWFEENLSKTTSQRRSSVLGDSIKNNLIVCIIKKIYDY